MVSMRGMRSTQFRDRFATVLCLCALAFSLRLAVQTALATGYFVDEIADTTSAAYNFFRNGFYTGVRYSDPFNANHSTGLPVTWISGLYWLGGFGNLFTQRLLLLAWHSLLLGGMTWLFLAELGKPNLKRVVVAAAWFWMFYLALVPNWQNLLLNLGELEGALLFGYALALRERRPWLAGICIGTALWGCKFVILPAALTLIFLLPGLEWLLGRRSFLAFVNQSLRLFAGSFAYLALFMIAMAFMANPGLALAWPGKVLHFVFFEGASGYTVDRAYSLAERLTRADFEWVAYSSGMKARILFLLFLPPALLLFELARERFRSRLLPFLACLSLVSVAYAYWWFFRHPSMIYRHLQTALALSLVGAFWYFIHVQFSRRWQEALRFALPILFLFYFVRLHAALTGPAPVDGYYSERCREVLFSEACLGPTYYKIWQENPLRPAQLP